MTRGAIILCGGQSTRMGRDKAWLPFGPDEVMLQRVVRIVREVVEPDRIVVVAAVGQGLPELPNSVRVARDRRPERGPLEGLAVGLRTLGGDERSTTLRDVNHGSESHDTAAFVTSCDVPLLVPAFVERLFELLGGDRVAGATSRSLRQDAPATDCGFTALSPRSLSQNPKTPTPLNLLDSSASPEDGGGELGIGSTTSEADGCIDIVVPREDRFHHPLSAIYRVDLLTDVEDLLAADQLRMRFLFEKCRTLEVPTHDLLDVDPTLDSLVNCNRPEDYAAALARCGFAEP